MLFENENLKYFKHSKMYYETALRTSGLAPSIVATSTAIVKLVMLN